MNLQEGMAGCNHYLWATGQLSGWVRKGFWQVRKPALTRGKKRGDTTPER